MTAAGEGTGIGVVAGLRLAILALGTFVISTGTFVLAGLLPAIQRELDVSAAQVGRLTFAFTLAYAVWAPLSGVLTRRWDRRLTLVAGLTLFAAGTALTAMASSYSDMTLSRVLAGAGAGMFTPAASASAVELVPVRWRARAVAAVIGGLAAATVLAVPVGNVVGELAGFRPVLWSVVGLSAAACLALAALPALTPAPGSGARAEVVDCARVAGPLLLVSLLLSVADFAVYTYVVPLLDHLISAGPAVVAGLLFLYGCAGVAGNLLGGQLADRWGPRRTVVTSLVLLGLSTAAMPGARHLAPVAVVVVVWGVSGWMVVPALQSELLTLRPAAAGLLATANASVIYAGMALGSLLGGVVLSAGSAAALGPLGAAFALAALLLHLTGHRRATRAPGPTAGTPAPGPLATDRAVR
ncbi:MFS transporter [Streptomyces sp. P38-E01]|uniref:MFS transporter n=1 Tax=Streptomyces tardus TaxID=2780544 RepID=A0A949JCZ6_9ACTN|nr:MFS transporter [Streptomyces tardus]MBU7596250.1 MFS transporter [Streptomyces tardus]